MCVGSNRLFLAYFACYTLDRKMLVDQACLSPGSPIRHQLPGAIQLQGEHKMTFLNHSTPSYQFHKTTFFIPTYFASKLAENYGSIDNGGTSFFEHAPHVLFWILGRSAQHRFIVIVATWRQILFTHQ